MIARITTDKNFADSVRYQFVDRRAQPSDKPVNILVSDPTKKIQAQAKAFTK